MNGADCDDNRDDDGDGLADFPADPGCRGAFGKSETSQCQDGLDNDNQAGIDYDGGASLDLDSDGYIDSAFNPTSPPVGDPDPQCGHSWHNLEAPTCGLGAELAIVLPPLLWWRQRRRGTTRA